jgi:hypothetical protein
MLSFHLHLGRIETNLSEMLRIPHCLDSGLTDGGEVVSLTHRPRFTPQKYYLFLSPIAISVRG